MVGSIVRSSGARSLVSTVTMLVRK
jgi:hypothetical protein